MRWRCCTCWWHGCSSRCPSGAHPPSRRAGCAQTPAVGAEAGEGRGQRQLSRHVAWRGNTCALLRADTCAKRTWVARRRCGTVLCFEQHTPAHTLHTHPPAASSAPARRPAPRPQTCACAPGPPAPGSAWAWRTLGPPQTGRSGSCAGAAAKVGVGRAAAVRSRGLHVLLLLLLLLGTQPAAQISQGPTTSSLSSLTLGAAPPRRGAAPAPPSPPPARLPPPPPPPRRLPRPPAARPPRAGMASRSSGHPCAAAGP